MAKLILSRVTERPTAPARQPDPRGRYGYQQDGIRELGVHPRFLLSDTMRLGKSRQAILAATGRTLVAAPAMVLDFGTWTDEHQRWRPDLDLTQTSYHGLPRKTQSVSVRAGHDHLQAIDGHLSECAQHRHKATAWAESGRLVMREQEWACVVETSQLAKGAKASTGVRFLNDLSEHLRGPWDTVIFDEAHHLKGHDTSWAIAAEKLAAPEQAANAWLLSGTPFNNWAHELWRPLRILRPEDAKPGGPLGSRWRWIQQWFRVEKLRGRRGQTLTEYHVDGTLLACGPSCRTITTAGGCDHWEQFRQSELRDLWMRRVWDDVMPDLPPLVGADKLIPVSMTTKQREVYRRLRKEMLATVPGTDEDVVAWNKAGLYTKLRKVATGLECVSSVRSSGKLDAMEDRIANRTRPTLIVAHFHDTLDAIEDRLRGLGLSYVEVSGRTPDKRDRLRAREAFQRGDVACLVGQVEAVAEGADLSNGDLAVIVEHSWRPSKNQQVWTRLRSPEDPTPVAVDRLVTRDTVDENMQEVLKDKSDHFVAALPPRELAKLF